MNSAAQNNSPFFLTQYVYVKGIRTRYAMVGNGETIVFIHGFPENLQTWRFYPRYIPQEFRMVVFDLKGFGYSDKPVSDYSPKAMADFVKDFMDTLNLDKVYLVGTDIGLTIACAFALQYPERLKKLMLMAGTINKKGIKAWEVKLLSVKLLGEAILYFFSPLVIRIGLKKGFYSRRLLSRQLIDEYYKPFKEPACRKATLELLRAFDQTGEQLSDEIGKINVPTLILWAEHERFFTFNSAQGLQKRIRDSQLKIISGCGHFIQEEKPKESANEIISFIQQD